MVFYLKYRPQKLKELDSENVREKLISVLSGKNIPHAFLFTGPKGLGKTSAARILAKALNCEARNKELGIKNKGKKEQVEKKHNSSFMIHNSNVEPCNKCLQCTSITSGTNMDVLEIDGASNRGIDEIRDLREKIRLLPFSASKKVYVIDEVHMLTTEAFNALLKTLEEPPSHAVFILCTTEPHKIPGTILSRCFHISFKKANTEELVRSFERIVKGEDLKIEKEVLSHIASLSDGSFRDGVKILEELAISMGKKKITKEIVEEKFQITNISGKAGHISKMLEYFEKKDAKQGLKLISKIIEQGMDMKFFIEQTINELHKMLLIKAGVNTSESEIELGIEDIKQMIGLLSKAHGELKSAVLPQLPLELAIIEYTQNQAEQKEPISKPSRSQVQRSSASESSAFFSDKNASGRAPISNSQRSIGEKIDLWQELILGVKPYNHSVAGVLRGCSLKSFDGKSLIIETGYKFHKERLEERKTLEIIGKVCKDITRKNVEVSIILKGGVKNV